MNRIFINTINIFIYTFKSQKYKCPCVQTPESVWQSNDHSRSSYTATAQRIKAAQNTTSAHYYRPFSLSFFLFQSLSLCLSLIKCVSDLPSVGAFFGPYQDRHICQYEEWRTTWTFQLLLPGKKRAKHPCLSESIFLIRHRSFFQCSASQLCY